MKRLYLPLFIIIFWIVNFSAWAADFSLESPAFKLNSMIPTEYTCGGADQSPPLIWHNAPPKTQSFALVVEDPDASAGVWTHWVLFNIPPTVTQLDAGSPVPDGAATGINSWSTQGYRGPCPPIGAHRYVFKLYALDKVLDLGNGTTRGIVLDAMTGHVLASTELVGLYQKIP